MKTKRNFPAHLLTILSITAFSPLHAADTAAGKAMHDKNCLACHDTGVYTRENRQIISLDALRKRVTRCELSQGMDVTPEQTEDIVQYLNESFYQFK